MIDDARNHEREQVYTLPIRVHQHSRYK
jgi:hypothetical protein